MKTPGDSEIFLTCFGEMRRVTERREQEKKEEEEREREPESTETPA